MFEYCELYITGVRHLGLNWVQDPDGLLDEINNVLMEIERFNFIYLTLNMSQIYNYHLRTNNYDSMMIYIKGAKYKGQALLSVDQLMELESHIKYALGYVYGLTFLELELRSARKYEFEELEELKCR